MGEESKRELPDWAGPLKTVERLDQFEELVLRYFAMRGMETGMEDGVVYPAGATAEKLGEQRWGLGNLLQTCARAPEGKWEGLVSEHFARVLGAQAAAAESEIDSFDYGRIADRLVVRLWEEGAFGQSPVMDALVLRRDIPGLMSVLSMDLPQTVRTVPRKEMEIWGREPGDLFDRAMDNVERLSEAKTEAHEIGDGATIVSVLGDSHFVASLALRIDRRRELIGKHGTFVGLPTRHVMLAAPFGGLDAIKSLQHLIVMTRRWCEDGPGSLSPRVWWYREEGGENVWREIVCEVGGDGEQLNVMPPEELVELLNELGGGRE